MPSPFRRDQAYFTTRQLRTLLEFLHDPECRGVEVVGPAGSGKTTLLIQAQVALVDEGRHAFAVPVWQLPDEREFGNMMVQAVIESPMSGAHAEQFSVRSSRSEWGVAEAAELLHTMGRDFHEPVLFLDGLEVVSRSFGVAGAIDDLSRRLPNWRIVVSSRAMDSARLRRIRGFRTLEVAGLAENEANRFLRSIAPDLPAEVAARLVETADGSPLYLRLLAQRWQEAPALIDNLPQSLSQVLDQTVSLVLERSSNPRMARSLLRRLALSDAYSSIEALAADLECSVAEVRNLLIALAPLVNEVEPNRVAIVHRSIQEIIVDRQLWVQPFRLLDMDFGAEEAERDGRLDASYVQRPGVAEILAGERTIVLGDRGSGKSAIFKRVCSGAEAPSQGLPPAIRPVLDPSATLQRIAVEGSEPATAEEYRAAWLLIAALTVSSDLPSDAPKDVAQKATALRAAFGLATARHSPLSRIVRILGRGLAGTSVTFGVGPVNLTAKAPEAQPSSGRRKSYIDIEGLLKAIDEFLVETGRSAIIPIDRIDELFKYDRQRQERLIQGLFQAEHRIAQLRRLSVVLFLRTDLFELYDIQEKNKLVSRTLRLEWSEEDWLRVLVNRVIANAPARELIEAATTRSGASSVDLSSALEAIFPGEVDGQPIDRWLLDSVQNGNGSISPRLVVLLLVTARDEAASREALVSRLPLFGQQTVRDAMARVSQLSYAEVVDDFKVARGFVLSVRAGKLREFSQSDVTQLFDISDGPIAIQVQLLERLGFLERLVIAGEEGSQLRFRVPPLYTRCWDHA